MIGKTHAKYKDFIKKYYEGLAYLFFGGVATLLNLVVFAVFQAAFGTDFATGLGNVLDNILCILFAYWTNRTFVFKSANKGKAALAEFGQFVSCRIATMVMDQLIIWLGAGSPLCGSRSQAVGHGRKAVQSGRCDPLQLCFQQIVYL